ncbi:MAG: hypothetical protein FJZ01_28460, partial [Candidatus Sericytochromatia bacterium]|nr:hypothetical protein [Candidatus Tanganyikabacteria bacterium]
MALMAIGPSNAANPGGKPAGPVRPDAPVLTLARDEWRPAPAVAGERSWWRMSPAERRRKDLADLARVQRRSVVAGLAGAGIAALGL